MKKINLILGTHNHQPIGNFDSVFTHAYEHAYQPFIDLLEKYPRVKMTQHYTGILFDWFVTHRPELLKQIGRLVRKGQVEVMGGAYYEAILSVIPDGDKFGQLEKLSRTVRKLFGEDPVGMWLAERVWEQHLTRFIADAGLQYIVVDDTHFKYAGFSDEELLGYYVTEEQGRTISMFPISKRLRYTIPFQPVQRTIDYLRSLATEDGTRTVVFADDGEKFGVWPKTYEHVYKSGWLEEFFKAVTDNADWITVLHFKDAIKTLPPVGRTYLPNASYAEMMHWALPTHHFTLYEEFEEFLKNQNVLEKYESFFKGGFWRNFMAKYHETNNMHKKMMRVSARAERVSMNEKRKRSPLTATREKIWAAQCNDAYWHGVFGGMYLPVLRYPIYHHLISAECDLDRIEKKQRVDFELTDFDCDGKEEILIETPVINLYIKPDLGGSVFELDFKPISLNLLDIVSRREEGYHHKLTHSGGGPGSGVASIHDIVAAKEPGLEQHLNYDWYRHGSLIDHFFGGATQLDDVWRSKYVEEGDFVNQPYAVSVRKDGGRTFLELTRNGAIWRNGAGHKVSIKKTISISAKDSQVRADYVIRNREDAPIDVWFGCEWNVGLQAGSEPDRYYYAPGIVLSDPQLRSKGELPNQATLGLRDEWLGVDVLIDAGASATFWRFPIETVSLSESGFERIFQSSVVIPNWKIHLEREWRSTFMQTIRQLKKKG